MSLQWQRAVIKIGSNLIAPGGHQLSVQHVLGIAQFVAQARAMGREVIVVSSGAVAAGRAQLHAQNTDTSIAAKQALAAIGQAQLMRFWQQFFDAPVAQLLLTRDDLSNRRRFVNARNTLRELLALQVIPIINENDSVAVDELRVGDNDNLAAHVAALSAADLLIIASDIDGLYDADPRINAQAKLIARVEQIDGGIVALAGGAGSSVGTGGMRTKLQAAKNAAEKGIDSVIVNGQNSAALLALLNGTVIGTHFLRTQSPLSAKKHWLLHVLPSSGNIDIDAGAFRALRDKGASLLPSGLLGVHGEFAEGDAISVHCNGQIIGKGIAQYCSADLQRLIGCQSQQISQRLGYSNGETVIHRDDFALSE